MNNRSGCILSVDAGGTFLKAALIQKAHESAELVEGSFFKVPVDSDGNAEKIKAAYREAASRGKELSEKNKIPLEGISVCIPGPFDYSGGICLMEHKYRAIYGIPMRPWFEQVIGKIPIRFLHDSTAFLLGATWNHRYSRFRRIAGVIIGTGLGFASMFDGKVFENDRGGPGISIYARPCRGKTAEDYVSRRALIAHYRELRKVAGAESTFDSAGKGTDNAGMDTGNTGIDAGNIRMDAVDMANLARSGQAEAIMAFEDMGICLAEILYDIINDNGFECLLLGGGISKSADLFLPAMRRKLAEIPTLKVIEAIDPIDDASLLGAARAMWMQQQEHCGCSSLSNVDTAAI